MNDVSNLVNKLVADYERLQTNTTLNQFLLLLKAIDKLSSTRVQTFEQDFIAKSLVFASKSRLAVPYNPWTSRLERFSFGVLLARSRTIADDLSYQVECLECAWLFVVKLTFRLDLMFVKGIEEESELIIFSLWKYSWSRVCYQDECFRSFCARTFGTRCMATPTVDLVFGSFWHWWTFSNSKVAVLSIFGNKCIVVYLWINPSYCHTLATRHREFDSIWFDSCCVILLLQNHLLCGF